MYSLTPAWSYNTSAFVKLHLAIKMMQMMLIAFLASPPPQKTQRITSKTTSKTLFGGPPNIAEIRLYVALSRATPWLDTPTSSLRSPNTTRLAPSTKARCCKKRGSARAQLSPWPSACAPPTTIGWPLPLLTASSHSSPLSILSRLREHRFDLCGRLRSGVNSS